jgi:hypothetical protein
MNRAIFSQFIPIFLLFLFIAYPRVFVPFSHTVLGKLFSVFMIVFYSTIDIMYGSLACVIVILYYQTDYAEGMKSMDEEKQNDSFVSTTDLPEPISKNAVVDVLAASPTGQVSIGASTVSSAPSDKSSSTSSLSGNKVPSKEFSTSKKLTSEIELQTPKSSNDWTSTVWKNIYEMYKPTEPVDSIGVKTEPFSAFSR